MFLTPQPIRDQLAMVGLASEAIPLDELSLEEEATLYTEAQKLIEFVGGLLNKYKVAE